MTVMIRATCYVLTSVLLLLAGQDVPDQYDTTTVMIPMRDGVRLHTIILRPRAQSALLPILIERTPYNAEGCSAGFQRATALVQEQYLFVCQDIRGKYGSEGTFSMIRPTKSQGDSGIDETTDAWDTIDWLVKQVERHNGRLGMRGISYPGWTTMMALLDPHPALKAASPQASPDDMFLGDDFHHNGAFRLSYGFEYVARVDAQRSTLFEFDRVDTYDWFLRLGGLANVDAQYFKFQKPAWTDFVRHPAFDDYWKSRKVVRHISRVTVPTLTVAGWWDQEDFYGPLTIYEKMESLDTRRINYLVVGPWNHGGWSRGAGSSLGPIQFGSNTGPFFRDTVEAPWFAYWLKGKGTLDLPEALTFRPGSNTWQRHTAWPPREGVSAKKLFLGPRGTLSWAAPTAADGVDRYVSDPSRPVPYRTRPIFPLYGGTPPSTWSRWQVDDQRHSHNRPDVLTFETEPLTEDVTLSGAVVAHLFASTTGSDVDWIVKLIDAYPDRMEDRPEMGGYQLMVVGDVFRARFRESFEAPKAVIPDEVNEYRISLHSVDYTFKSGHRIMVQVQSTWFPLIDRNPQTFVPNIFEARDGDYRTATQSIYRSVRFPSHLEVATANP